MSPTRRKYREIPEITEEESHLNAVIKRPGQPDQPYRANQPSLLTPSPQCLRASRWAMQERLLLAAERPDQVGTIDPPSIARIAGRLNGSQSSAPPESKLNPVTVKQLVHMGGKQQAVWHR